MSKNPMRSKGEIAAAKNQDKLKAANEKIAKAFHDRRAKAIADRTKQETTPGRVPLNLEEEETLLLSSVLCEMAQQEIILILKPLLARHDFNAEIPAPNWLNNLPEEKADKILMLLEFMKTHQEFEEVEQEEGN